MRSGTGLEIDEIYLQLQCCSCDLGLFYIRRILVASNAIKTIDEMVNLIIISFIIYCLNCIRRDRNSTYKTGLTAIWPFCELFATAYLDAAFTILWLGATTFVCINSPIEY